MHPVNVAKCEQAYTFWAREVEGGFVIPNAFLENTWNSFVIDPNLFVNSATVYRPNLSVASNTVTLRGGTAATLDHLFFEEA